MRKLLISFEYKQSGWLLPLCFPHFVTVLVCLDSANERIGQVEAPYGSRDDTKLSEISQSDKSSSLPWFWGRQLCDGGMGRVVMGG